MKFKKGVAIFEFTFLIFSLLFTFVLIIGSWGITRPAILHSIAARTYLWNEVNQRDNTFFLRDNSKIPKEIKENIYWSLGSRFYVIVKEGVETFDPSERKMDVGGGDWSDTQSSGWLGLKTDQDRERLYSNSTSDELRIKQDRSQGSFNRNQRYQTSVVFLRIGYGICLDFSCEPKP